MKVEYKGADQYLIQLSKMEAACERVAGKAVYEGAKVVADAIMSNLKALPSVPDMYNVNAYRNKEKSKLSVKQKYGLINGFGIAKMKQTDGYWNVKAGFDGYNEISTQQYALGQPNPLIARVVEGGSSFMDATPFIKPAVQKSRKAAFEAMQKVINEEYAKFVK